MQGHLEVRHRLFQEVVGLGRAIRERGFKLKQLFAGLSVKVCGRFLHQEIGAFVGRALADAAGESGC
jgi:hypothetical protein